MYGGQWGVRADALKTKVVKIEIPGLARGRPHEQPPPNHSHLALYPIQSPLHLI